MSEQESAGRLPGWALMHAFGRDLDALLTTGASTAAVCTHWAICADQPQCYHTAEDQVMWPLVRAKLAGDPDGLALPDEMEAEHDQYELPPTCVAEAPDLVRSR